MGQFENAKHVYLVPTDARTGRVIEGEIDQAGTPTIYRVRVEHHKAFLALFSDWGVKWATLYGLTDTSNYRQLAEWKDNEEDGGEEE